MSKALFRFPKSPLCKHKIPETSLSRHAATCCSSLTNWLVPCRSCIVSGHVLDTYRDLQCFVWKELDISCKIRACFTLTNTSYFHPLKPLLQQCNVLLKWVFAFTTGTDRGRSYRWYPASTGKDMTFWSFFFRNFCVVISYTVMEVLQNSPWRHFVLQEGFWGM
jgi:hypothetical protein